LAKLYTFKLDKNKEIFIVKVKGYFEEEDAKLYISEFQTIVNTINPSKYTLIIDGTEQAPVSSQVMEDIGFVLKVYSMANFKRIIIVNPASEVSRLQVDSCVRELNFQGIFVGSVEEAYNL
jgi:hypothetical protein